MATFTQLATIAADPGYQRRVQYATTVAALAVYNESFGGNGQPTAQQHLLRAGVAIKVLSGAYNFGGCYIGVLTNPTIAAESNSTNTPDFSIPDGDIQFAVNSLWNALAGA